MTEKPTPNHAEVYATATVAAALFGVAWRIVVDQGCEARWGTDDSTRIRAAATLTQAMAVIYAAQNPTRRPATKPRTPRKTKAKA